MLDELIGKQIWLDYFDQNTKFEQAFKPQFCTIERRLACVDWGDDWYLVRLTEPLDYDAARYTHLLIRSRWQDSQIADPEPTSVFILLVPDPNSLTDPFEAELKMFAAWGMASQTSDGINKLLRRPT